MHHWNYLKIARMWCIHISNEVCVHVSLPHMSCILSLNNKTHPIQHTKWNGQVSIECMHVTQVIIYLSIYCNPQHIGVMKLKRRGHVISAGGRKGRPLLRVWLIAVYWGSWNSTSEPFVVVCKVVYCSCSECLMIWSLPQRFVSFRGGSPAGGGW
jgi:hypothetical protein